MYIYSEFRNAFLWFCEIKLNKNTHTYYTHIHIHTQTYTHIHIYLQTHTHTRTVKFLLPVWGWCLPKANYRCFSRHGTGSKTKEMPLANLPCKKMKGSKWPNGFPLYYINGNRGPWQGAPFIFRPLALCSQCQEWRSETRRIILDEGGLEGPAGPLMSSGWAESGFARQLFHFAKRPNC